MTYPECHYDDTPMSPDQVPEQRAVWFFVLVMAVVLATIVASGCASIRRGAWTGGGAAAGAAIGSLAGPAGSIGGAAVGGVAGQAMATSDGFESGSIIGEDALTKQRTREFETLRTALAAMGAKLDNASRVASTAMRIADSAANHKWWTLTLWQLIRGEA